MKEEMVPSKNSAFFGAEAEIAGVFDKG